ncbi:MAG: hypothetical protein H0X61_13335 [Acidimicrobiia bacterium]|jgi:hypothetical protein|nr:hypothetical protein [Acidimicrobiia bacterium]MBA3984498.1 hypothetical protein [Acidimicrobiia bacterium]MDQ3391955.1 hypothetical protein [Actinomycetota bacterium]
MAESSPADLAVAFRSFDRRRREALGDTDPSIASDLSSTLDEHIAAAGALLGTSADAASIGNELQTRHAEDWEENTLDELRSHAIAAGAVLRQIESRAASHRSGDAGNADDSYGGG